MVEGSDSSTGGSYPPPAPERVVYVQAAPVRKRGLLMSVLVYVGAALVVSSFLLNLVLLNGLAALALVSDGLREEYVSGSPASPSKVAIVNISGLIADGPEGMFGDGGNFRHVVAQLKKAREDDKVVSVLLEINSPGGSVTASDIILHDVERVQAAGKTVVVWMQDLAASGGYYVSCKADRIYACRTTLTGSIGVVMGLYNLEGLSDKVGVKPVLIKRGEFKDMGSPFREMTEAERKRFEDLADAAYERFKEVVKEGRKLSDEAVSRAADGSILTAQEALERRLIDKLGYEEEAIDFAKGTRADAAVVRYERSGGVLSALFSQSRPPAGEVRVRLDSPLPTLTPGLYYIWLPAAGLGR
jgi:protease-4